MYIKIFVNLARNGGYSLRKLQKTVVTETIFAENRHRYAGEIVTVTLHFIIPRITGPQIVVAMLTYT